jgi:GntR family transcriptional regulator, transcriptional repressor for pyruvate dehydrogenase complex
VRDHASRSARPRTVKMTEVIARRIVDDIVSRNLAPGVPLSTEVEMARAFGVSRATVREALRILETNGLVRIRPGRYGGPQVGDADPVAFGRSLTWFLQMRRTRFWELLEARVIMEPMMAALAAERRGAEALHELRGAIDAHRALDPDDQAGYLVCTQEFHAVIAGISGNSVLDLFGRALKEIYTERAIAAEQPAARREAVLREHEAVVDAILAGDRARAEESMRQHMVELAAGFRRNYGALGDELVGWW